MFCFFFNHPEFDPEIILVFTRNWTADKVAILKLGTFFQGSSSVFHNVAFGQPCKTRMLTHRRA